MDTRTENPMISPSPPPVEVARDGKTVAGQRATRVLFVSVWELGWKTWASQIEQFSAQHQGLDAVHLRVSQPRWLKALSRELPSPVGRALVSHKRAWEWHIRRTVARQIASGGFDVVFVSSQIMAPALVDPCRRAGARLAVSMDVTGPAYQRDLLGQEIPSEQTWADERAIYGACDLCVPWSSWIKDSLQRDFGVPAERILQCPPGVATARFSGEAPAQDKGRLPHILFCGNDFERKGGPQLVRWHQELWASKAELHIASSGAPPLENLPNVFRHGSVPHARLMGEMLPSSDLFCLPTRSDMSPFAVAEAQAAGLPTVSSRIGGLSDLVLDGQSGFLLAPDDEEGYKAAVTRLIDDPALRAAMRAGARRHADEHLDAAKVFPRLLDGLIALRDRS